MKGKKGKDFNKVAVLESIEGGEAASGKNEGKLLFSEEFFKYKQPAIVGLNVVSEGVCHSRA